MININSIMEANMEIYVKSSESIEGKAISKRVGKIPQKMDFKAVLRITWRNV